MASVQDRKNGSYTARYRDRFGSQQSAGTWPTRKLALAKASAAEAIEASGQDAKLIINGPKMAFPVMKRNHPTVAGYGETWLAKAPIRDTTRESYGCMLKHIDAGLGTMILKDLTPVMCRDFIGSLDGRMSGATRASVLTALRSLCTMAVQDGILGRDPTAGIKVRDQRAREMKILTAAESRRILAAIDPHYKLLVRAMLDTGLRWGEVIALRPDDITQTGGVWIIKVQRTIAEVGGKQSERPYGKTAAAIREVEIEDDLASGLAKLPRVDSDLTTNVARLNEHLFTAARGGRLQRSNFRRVWLQACDAAGVKGVRVHDIRHTHASWMVNADWDESPTAVLIKVGKRLGHTDTKTTARYLHVIPGNRGSVLDALRRAKAA
jgi:integrase